MNIPLWSDEIENILSPWLMANWAGKVRILPPNWEGIRTINPRVVYVGDEWQLLICSINYKVFVCNTMEVIQVLTPIINKWIEDKELP